jgi:hypothetical protein
MALLNGQKFFQYPGITKDNYLDTGNYHLITEPDVLLTASVIMTNAGSVAKPSGNPMFCLNPLDTSNADYWNAGSTLIFTVTRSPSYPEFSLTDPVSIDGYESIVGRSAFGFRPAEDGTVFALLVLEYLPPYRYRRIDSSTLIAQ